MIAVIMAGGEGSRLRPLTCDRPKPLVPICNRPVLAYTLDLLAEHGFQEVFLTLGYRPGDIRRTFGERYRTLKLHYVVEEHPLGTAGGVAALRDRLTERFLVISGDALTDIHLGELVRFHQRAGAVATLALKRVERPLEYGVVMTDREGRIRRFLEKPGWGEVFSDTVNTGIYVLEPSVLTGVPAGRMYDFSQNLFPALLQAGAPLYATVVDGYWCDIGDTETYLQANLDLLGGRLLFRPPGLEVVSGVWVDGEVPHGITVDGPALIGAGCRLAPGTSLEAGAVLGPGVETGPGSIIRRSVVGAGVRVGPEAALVGAVAGEGARLEERAGAFDGAVLGPGAVLGAGATLAPGVRLWQGVEVAPGARVETTLVRTPAYQSPVLRGGSLKGRPGTDLFPEAALRLGMAFGAVLDGHGPLIMGADPAPAAALLAQALLCGAMAVGRRVLDLGSTASPVTAYTTCDSAAPGGVHVRFDGQQARVVLYDGVGRPAGRSLQRKVEQAMARLDFPRATPEGAGEVERFPDAEERYLAWLAGQIDLEAIQAGRIGVSVAGADWPVLERWLPGPAGPAEPQTQLALRIDPLEATWRLVGATPEQMLALELLLQGRRMRPGAALPLPVVAPRALERWLNEAGRPTLRVRQADWVPADPLLAIGSLLEWMAQEQLTPADVLARLPVAHTAEVTVACPWEAKGRVMRALLEEHGEGAVELIDGLRIRLEGGTALLLPDPEEPVYRIFAEGEGPAEAAALAERYSRRVRELLGA
ncbi:MAG: sugar phosphate nucleotidyltransferase [Bacillota bacterium]